MKPLKSGIEMNPEELKNSKGGACSCGCDIYVSSTVVSVGGEEGTDCYCGCSLDPNHEMWASAFRYLN